MKALNYFIPFGIAYNPMFYYILFVIYFLAFCFLVNKIPFLLKSCLGSKWLTSLFILKVFAGLAIGWISARYYSEGNDYWTLNQYGIEETALLKNSPGEFFLSLFKSPYGHYSGFFTSVGSYWNDLKNNILIKFLAIANLASGGNYFINSLFFSFISFFGHIALFRLFHLLYPSRKLLIVAGAFLIPSTLYFSSGIHKDSIIFTALVLFTWSAFSLTERETRKHILLLFLSAAVLLLIRSHVFIVVVPAAVAWWLSAKKGVNHAFLKIYAIVFIALMILSFVPQLNPVSIVTKKQKDFFELPVAASQLSMDTLRPTIASLVRSTPRALMHGFAEPLPWKFGGEPLMILGMEAMAILGLLVFWLLRHEKAQVHPLLLYSVAVAIPLIVFAGYIVPNAGSIVRYRAIYLPWLILPVLCTIKLKHIKI